jgi:hypothetical protein
MMGAMGPPVKTLAVILRLKELDATAAQDLYRRIFR